MGRKASVMAFRPSLLRQPAGETEQAVAADADVDDAERAAADADTAVAGSYSGSLC